MNKGLITFLCAAGLGTRTGKLSKYYQKCALPIAEKPLIIHWIEVASSLSCETYINIMVGHHAGQVASHVTSWIKETEEGNTNKGGKVLPWERIPQLRLQNMKNNLWPEINKHISDDAWMEGRPLLVCYCDNYSPYLRSVVSGVLNSNSFQENDTFCILGLIPVTQCSSATEEAVLGMKKDNRLIEIAEYMVGQSSVPIDSLCWSGIALFSANARSLCRDCSNIHQAMNLMAQAKGLFGYRILEPYYDIQTVAENLYGRS